jgi:hypothetical protein
MSAQASTPCLRLAARTPTPSARSLATLCLLWACSFAAGCAELGGDEDAAAETTGSSSGSEEDWNTSGVNPNTDVDEDALSDSQPLIPPDSVLLNYEPGSFCSGAVQLSSPPPESWLMLATTGPASASTGRAEGGSFVLVSGPAWLLMRGDTPPSPVCGDGRIDAPELCEPSNLSGMTCADFGLSGAGLGCSVACVFDTSGCDADAPVGCECAPGARVGSVCSDFGFDMAGDSFSLLCGADCRVDLRPCGFPPVLNPVAADTFACGTSGGIPLCWGQNDSDILTLPRMPLLGGGADSFSAGDGFNAGIFNDTLLHHHAVARLLDAFGAELPTGTAPAAAVRSSANLLCTGTDSGGGGMDVSCYAVDSPSPPMPLSTGIADFALSDQTLCAIFQGSLEVACSPFSSVPYPLPIFAADTTDGTQKMVVDGSTVCLVHPNAPSLQSGTTGNVACWNAVSGSSVFSSIRDAVVSDLVSAKSSGLLCATLAEPFQSVTFGATTPAGEVFCWGNTGTSLDERGPIIDPGTGAGFDADRLALSGDYLCAQDRNLGTRCVPRTADPSSHEGQGLVPDDRFAHVAMDPNPGITAGCAVRADGPQAGAITCWGANRPLDIPNDTDFVQVAVSAAYICGLTDGGEVRCAGGSSPTEQDLSSISAGERLLTGVGVMCGLRRDGSLRCWDATGADQLTEAGPFVKVSVGEGFACAIDLNDTPQCFGFLDGNGVPPYIGQLPSATALDLSLGLGSACVIDTDQRIQCWGASASLVPAADAQGPFIQVTTSIDGVCAVEDPTGPRGAAASVVCWGAAASVVQGMRKSVQALSIGDAGVCALRRNGYLACWGAYALGYR